MPEYFLAPICSDLVFRGTNGLHISNADVSLSLFAYLGLIARYLEELFKLVLIVYFILVPLLSTGLILIVLFLKYLPSCFAHNHFKPFILYMI